ncbi:hypothetical protein A6A08_25970 [Nocardiopsis sp. TSRI0078]|uniref:DUF3500 domain-containing protein n=1 Tax=unclassified Nocardiopsis TaxID=2649073 RepID=UPI0009679AD8|nr:DUF3500 domain-containing protein [Nocardiopsis sp. TSRI0078]OKI17477.1 hypothetical protein A6A08_25970 [Nocardiopsis sp. TSRI0078]
MTTDGKTTTTPDAPAERLGARARLTRFGRHGATALALGVGLLLTGCAAPGAEATSANEAATSTSSGNANTAEVVAAADAFLDTLSEEQRQAVVYDFADEAKATGWSNFPVTFVERNGISLSDLDEEQEKAALAVMEAALSEEGYRELLDIRAADAYLDANQDDTSGSAPEGQAPDGRTPDGQGPGGEEPPEGGGGPGGGDLAFGEDLYHIAFFGEPSETEQFMVQYGGHHAAYNITYEGDDVSLSPTLTGTEPMEFEYEGESYAPLEDKRSGALEAVASLSGEQLARAEIENEGDDLVLGPGEDGPFPEEEGILVSDLDQEQQDKVTEMLRAWVGDLDEEAAEALVDKYVSEYGQTYLSWSGSTEPDEVGTYIRLDGPSAWIEYSNQPGVETDQVHQHTMFRDQTADYGWE